MTNFRFTSIGLGGLKFQSVKTIGSTAEKQGKLTYKVANLLAK